MSDAKKSVSWYETAYIVVLLGVLVLSMTYLRPHCVGVVNLDTAFKKLAVGERLSTAMREKDLQAQARFVALKKASAGEEKALLAAFKAAQSEEEKGKVQGDFMAYQARMQKSRAEIAETVQRFQRDVVMTFRERMRPHVQKVAARKRVDLVIEPEQVFQILNKSVDMTDTVIEDARSEFSPDKPLVDEALLKSKGLWIEDDKAAPAASVPAG